MGITESKSKRKNLGSIIFILFIIMNALMLAISIYTLYFSSAAPFAEKGIVRDITFWVGAFKNVVLLSGVWIFMEIIFSAYFFIKKR
ncbi:MAG: hypothetical protein ACRC0C_16145 [Gibbsiella quercinecans]|uniref:hypothetical protein n=1 Tax=Gibbsiella quercinecans TaxID=929813 RepID=UPI003F2E3505